MRTPLPACLPRIRSPRAALAVLAAFAFGMAARAEGLQDPTRPPLALAPAVAASGVVHAAPVPAAPLRVQSVQLRPQGGSSALVDGRLVMVGDRVGARTVAAIDAQGVQLRDAHGHVERLRLIDADVIKQAVAPLGAADTPLASLAGGQPR